MSPSAIQSSGPPPTNRNSLPPPRQIRFVSNDGQPHAKRRRINAACQTCRKRKTRCSGERPECKTCTENGHACGGFADSARQRKSSLEDGNDDEEENSGSTSPRKPENQPSPQHARSISKDIDSVPSLQQQGSAESSTSVKSNHGDEARTLRRSHGSPASNYTSNSMSSNRNRFPYFRYFGPTAIVPGFKQMVVQMKDQRRSVNSVPGESPASNAISGVTPSVSGAERSPIEIPFYDATDPLPISPMITHLCETFFTHLGCSFPFLQKERFLRDLEEKRVDAIVVDAMCAVAARFSSHPLLSVPSGHDVPVDTENEVKLAFRGHPFTHRAMSAVIDTFPCPTMAVAQACLLLAYEEFGSDHDSGLWMYLGTSIRMAQDLGIQKLQGLQLEGRVGPTPKTAKHGTAGKEEEKEREKYQSELTRTKKDKASEAVPLEDRRASEQERIDLFYCIFFLDRAVSSGVGRPVTLRDKDIEISFPYRPDDQTIDGWPPPFPPLIRIIHLYGRAADVLNNIKEVNQVTPEVLKRLVGMEKDLTGIYQRLSPKLHFNATNFQHYVKSGQGTNFILLHFWFHTLIVLLHQPTLLHSFEGRIQQLFPDSRELSMSSAKTIADILAFAELIDVKSFIGNPFTSQPMYIAACAFLAEVAAHASQPPSRGASPSAQSSIKTLNLQKVEEPKLSLKPEQHLTAKHTLLATAANQNYQRCYKALKALERYWAGTRYILTALDQKSKGIMDPLLFTSDDIDSEMPSTELNFTTPGWRRSTSQSASMGTSSFSGPLSRLRGMADLPKESNWSSNIDLSQAIGWSLSGTTNSPAPNLSFLYQTATGEVAGPLSPPSTSRSQYSLARTPMPLEVASATAKTAAENTMSSQTFTTQYPIVDQAPRPHQISAADMPPPPNKYSTLANPPVSTADADLLLEMHSPYPMSGSQPVPGSQATYDDSVPPVQPTTVPPPPMPAYDFSQAPPNSDQFYGNSNLQTHGASMPTPFSDMLIESQDIDMNDSHGGWAFPSGDMIPWLEYLPQDVLNYFGEPTDDVSMINPSGPGPLGNGHAAPR